MYALILAGGSGTRLWPYSRSGRPKQFLSLDGRTTMLQATVNRTLSIIPPERVYVATGAAYAGLVAEQLPEVPRANILVEPSGRGTAPCIGLAALHLLRRDPNAVMAVLSADHQIEDADSLCAALSAGGRIAQQGYLVTLGITPSEPSTGYGYIERGRLLAEEGTQRVFQVQAFAEKPNLERAEAYVASGNYFWNAGMFVWRADRILEELAAHRPAVAEPLARIDAAIGTPAQQQVLHTVWPRIENVAIDIAVMEQTADAVVIPAAFGWSDVGDWAALSDTLSHDESGNVVVGTNVSIDTRNSLIYGNGRLITTIGVQDLLIVDTADALLICSREHAQEVKTLVAQLRQQHTHIL